MSRSGSIWTFKRRHILPLAIGVVLGAAVALRVLNPPPAAVPGPASRPAPVAPADLPEPADYVLTPDVVDSEANAGPARIISLAPSATEIIAALGLDDRLVGRTPYCHYPPRVERVEQVGAMFDLNLERVRALKPDLVLTVSNSGPVVEDLRRLGVRFEAVPHKSIEEVFAAIERIGDLCARPLTARRLTGHIRADMDALRAWVERADLPRYRVLVTLGQLPLPPGAVWVAGPELYLEDLLTMCGQVNVAGHELKVPQGEVPLPRLLVMNPEVIIEFREQAGPAVMAEVYAAWSEVGPLEAIRRRRVRSVGGLEWLSASPRIALGLHRFITIFASLDMPAESLPDSAPAF